MDVAIISDSHIPSREQRIPDDFRQRIQRADHVIHAGDFDSKGAYADIEKLASSLTAVHGNMDPDIGLPTTTAIELGGVEFVVTHGTGSPRGWKQRVATAVGESATTETATGIAGHTHQVTDIEHEDVRILNPGSVTGADPAAEATMMSATAEKARLDVTVHRA